MPITTIRRAGDFVRLRSARARRVGVGQAALDPVPWEARGEWVDQHFNCRRIGGSGIGKTHLATGWGPALRRLGERVRLATAAVVVTGLGATRPAVRPGRARTALDRLDLLTADELGDRSLSRAGAELLLQVFARRYGRGSLLVTSRPPFGAWEPTS